MVSTVHCAATSDESGTLYTRGRKNSDGSCYTASEPVTVNEIYSNVSWARGVSGDFATASNWTPAEVPGPANDVTIGVKGNYTVTSSADEIVDNLTNLK